MSRCLGILRTLEEGGLVTIPNGLALKVLSGVKEVIMSQVIYHLTVARKNFSALVDDRKGHPNEKDFKHVVHLMDVYIDAYPMYKGKKSDVKGKRIEITKDDMKPFDIPQDFSILLTTKGKSNKGSLGSISTKISDPNGFMEELPLFITFDSLSNILASIDLISSRVPILHAQTRDNTPVDEFSLKVLKDIHPTFKELQAKIHRAIEQCNELLRHELVHVVQQQTGQGYNHKALRDEGGYIALDTKKRKGQEAEKAYFDYATGSREVKAYLQTHLDGFYARAKQGKLKGSINDQITYFIKDMRWFKSFKDEKQRKAVMRDFTTAVMQDRRFRSLKET